jgi:hypothetical protein
MQSQAISITTPELSVLTLMDENTPNPQPSPNAQNPQGQRREGPRHHGGQRRSNYRGQAPRPAENRPAEKPVEKPVESKDTDHDDEETEQDRSAAPSRQSRGGGRGKPPKRVIEEWANDIYCE